jgi:hypothetical protein
MRGGPDSEGSIDPNETPEERERREKDRRAANNARERLEKAKKNLFLKFEILIVFQITCQRY